MNAGIIAGVGGGGGGRVDSCSQAYKRLQISQLFVACTIEKL